MQLSHRRTNGRRFDVEIIPVQTLKLYQLVTVENGNLDIIQNPFPR